MGVILVVIVYILYKVIDEKGRTISDKKDLSKGASAVNVKNTGKPDSTRYYIGTWLYVNATSASTVDIFKINQGTDDFLTLQLTNSAVLKYIAKTDSGTATHVIMDNFPLQKWVYVVISVDNNVVDLYIDGKLIRSHKVDIKQVGESSDIEFGILDAFIAKMEREPKPMDPSYAWSKYMEGNGGNYFSRMLANYGGTLTLTKNDMDVREFQLF